MMQKQFSVFNFVVSMNFYLSFGIALTGFSFALLFDKMLSIQLFFILFLTTFSLYSLNRLTDKAEDLINNPIRVLIVKKYEKPLSIFSVLAYIFALWFAWQENLITFLIVILILFIGVIYSVKIPLLKEIVGYSRLKNIFFGKNLAIATNWTLAMVIIPSVYYAKEISFATFVLIIFIFFRSIINTIIFDLGDIEGDKKQRIKTIPIVFGFKKTVKLFYFLNTLLGIMVFVAASIGVLPPIAHLINISTLLVYLYLFLLDKPTIIRQRILLDWVVDGEYLLIGCSLLIGAKIL
jgi:4-hydroxybenzoate polyprenyltransferase